MHIRLKHVAAAAAILAAALLQAAPTHAGTIVSFSDATNGLAAEAEFTILGGTSDTLIVRVRNTSTNAVGLDNAGQLLTGVSWDFGQLGDAHGAQIVSGAVVIGPTSQSVNFDKVAAQLGAGDDVSVEWGYGNGGGSGALVNFITGNTAQATPFQAVNGANPNLDGPSNMSGPQAGLVAPSIPVPLGGLGAIQSEIIATLNLSQAVSQSQIFGDFGLVRFEFGSDAAFYTVPEPASAMLLVAGLVVIARRR